MGYAVKLSSGSKGKLQRTYCGGGDSNTAVNFNIANILPKIYKELTLDNFGVTVNSIATRANGQNWSTGRLFNTYNPSNGILYCNMVANYSSNPGERQRITYYVYCWYVD